MNIWIGVEESQVGEGNVDNEMRIGFEPVEFELRNPAHHARAAELWTRACGEHFALSARALAFNTQPPLGARQAGRFARIGGELVGFVLASVLPGQALTAPPERGWIDALAVAPEWQNKGIGHALLSWGEDWLRAQGCRSARLGGSLRTFAPGVPTELHRADFFLARGYGERAENGRTWDLGADLAQYASPKFIRQLPVKIHPMSEGDVDALRAFLTREFPGRWLYEFEQHLRDGERLDEYLILKSERGVEACCIVTFEDSVRPVEHFYPAPLPRPWGQAGSIGVSADRRGAGYGSALLDAALRHLRGRGVRGCIIDWTYLVSYYERFGFKPHREYLMLTKSWE